MKNRTATVVIASAFGAMNGVLVGIQLSNWLQWEPSFDWLLGIVGALIGSIVGYCAIDLKGLWQGLCRAYHDVSSWKPDKLYWKGLFLFLLWGQTVIAPAAFLFLLCFCSLPAGMENETIWTAFDQSRSFTWLTVLCIVIGLAWSSVRGIDKLNTAQDKDQVEEDWNNRRPAGMSPEQYVPHQCLTREINNVRQQIVQFNIVRISLWLIEGFLWVLNRLVDELPTLPDHIIAFGQLLKEFIARVFVLIHSDERMITLFAAFAGATAGYIWFDKNALIGAVAGGAIGFIEHKLIAGMWLKLKPQQA